ncbi:MAG: tetratricopeptide repeat protein [Deltaproteobacteria bacterium]|nr:tetratricopeptide repeat protein [Deltaproteobacteria bacterium]
MSARFATAAAIVFAAALAHADSRAEAIVLFDQGIAEMKAGNYDKACASFARSLQLVPDTGTKGSLARCLDKQGKVASSWLLWRELADTAPSEDLRKDAAAQADKLAPRVPKYAVTVAAPTAGLAVTINGKPVDPTLDVQVPVDPGPLVAVASAPGHVAWKSEQLAAEGAVVTVQVPALERVPVSIVTPPEHGLPPPPPPKRGQRNLGFVALAAGGAALVAGGVFGLTTASHWDKAQELCGGDVDRCPPNQVAAAQAEVDKARSAGTISTALFVAGGVVAATGIVLVITAPKARRERAVAVTPVLGPDGAGFVLTGRL